MLAHSNAIIKLLFFMARGSCYRNCSDAKVFYVTLFLAWQTPRIRTVV